MSCIYFLSCFCSESNNILNKFSCLLCMHLIPIEKKLLQKYEVFFFWKLAIWWQTGSPSPTHISSLTDCLHDIPKYERTSNSKIPVFQLFSEKILFNLKFKDRNKQSFNPFQANSAFLYHLKTSKYWAFSDVFSRYRKKLLAWNGLMNCKNLRSPTRATLVNRSFQSLCELGKNLKDSVNPTFKNPSF